MGLKKFLFKLLNKKKDFILFSIKSSIFPLIKKLKLILNIKKIFEFKCIKRVITFNISQILRKEKIFMEKFLNLHFLGIT
jgi:hypothetical protein